MSILITIPPLKKESNSCPSFCRFLIDSRWFKQWKKYVGFDSWDMYNVGEHSLYPGPVDNSGLFSGKKHTGLGSRHSHGGTLHKMALWVCCLLFALLRFGHNCQWSNPANTWWRDVVTYQLLNLTHFLCSPADHETQILKDHLIDELDYVLVPTEAWNKLVSWYGCLEGQRPIVRKVMLLERHYYFHNSFFAVVSLSNSGLFFCRWLNMACLSSTVKSRFICWSSTCARMTTWTMLSHVISAKLTR